MFTFYAEIPTKNLTIEVPTFSEDQEAFSTYSPAEIDASFDFQFVAYQPSSEFQLIGQAVCEAPAQDPSQELETPYSYAPIYAEESELSSKASEFEETIPTRSSFTVENSTIQQDTTIDPSYRYIGEFRKIKDAARLRRSTKRSSIISESEISSQNAKKGRIHQLLSGDKNVLDKRSHLGLQFNQASFVPAHKNTQVPFKGSQEGRGHSITGYIKKERQQQPLNISDRHQNLNPTEQEGLESFTDSDLSSSKHKLQPNDSDLFRESFKKEKVSPIGNCDKNKRKEEEGNSPGFEVETAELANHNNVHRVNIAPTYNYQLRLQKQKPENYRQSRKLDTYDCFIPYDYHQVLATEHPLLCNDYNLRFNLSKAVAPASSLSRERSALDASFFDHNSF